MSGRPELASPVGRYFKLSTAVVAPADRRAFWRDVALNRTDPDFPPVDGSRWLSAQVRGLAGDGSGSEVREGQSDAVIMRRTASRCRQDGIDEIMLGFLVSSDGPAHYRRGDTEYSVPPGGIVVNDSAVPFTVVMPRYRAINFRLPRSAVSNAIDDDPACLTGRVLSETPLNRLLFTYFMQFVDEMEEMDDAARQVALRTATDFTLAVLRNERRGGVWDDAERSNGLRRAVQRFVERNLHRADLNPDTLARALHCSRTHLYRLFSGNGETVMGYVREIRLVRSRAMLANAACHMTIGEIGLHCGFEDASAFSRTFRRRFGCQPSDVRRESSGGTL